MSYVEIPLRNPRRRAVRQAQRMLFVLAAIVMAPQALLAQDEAEPPQRDRAPLADRASLFDRLDRNGDGAVTLDEIDEERRQMFDRLLRAADKNGDGKIEREEFAQAGPQRRRPPQAAEGQDAPERARGRRPAADRSEPGGAGPPENRPPFGGDPRRMFERMDANGDGKVTLDEIPEERRPRFEQMMNRADKNGDQALDAEEMRAAFAEMTARFRQAQRPERPADAPRPGGNRLMRVLDGDYDGVISGDELAAASEALKKLDANGDGKLTRDEFEGGPQPPRRPGGPDARPRGPDAPRNAPGDRPAGDRPSPEAFLERFKNLDQDGDGALSQDEAPERLRGAFERLDIDGDGKLGPRELRRAFNRPRGEPDGEPGDRPRDRRPEREAE